MNENREVEHAVASGFREIADSGGTFADQTAGVRRRARQLRRRRRAGAVVAAAAVTVTAGFAAVPIKDVLLPPDDAHYLGGMDSDQNPPEAADAVTLDWADIADELPDGPPPDVPWYHNGEIRSGDRVTPFDPGSEMVVRSVVGVEGGYLVHVAHEHRDVDQRALVFVEPDGERRSRVAVKDLLLPGPLLSADGSTMAWTEIDGTPEHPKEVVLADVVTGEELSRTPIAPSESETDYEGARGFLGDRILLTGSGQIDGPVDDRVGAGLLDPATGTISEWLPGGEDSLTVWKVSPDQELAAVGSLNGADCTAVIQTADREPLWDDCGFTGSSFSPDGRYVVGSSVTDVAPEDRDARTGDRDARTGDRDARTGDRDASALEVRDARTGDKVLTIESFPRNSWLIAWEPDGDFVVEISRAEDADAALVRCSIDGDCELATGWYGKATPNSWDAVLGYQHP